MKRILMILLLTVLQACVARVDTPAVVDVHVREKRPYYRHAVPHYYRYPAPRYCPPGHARKGWC